MTRLLVSALVIVALVFGIGWIVFVSPEDDVVTDADAVVVLAGSEDRLPVALSLVSSGVADELLVSEADEETDPARAELCRTGEVRGVTVICRWASPYSTRGEARMTARIAKRRQWDRIVVVTSDYHRFRAEKLFERCTDAEVLVRSADEPWWKLSLAIPLEWVKLVRSETTQRGC